MENIHNFWLIFELTSTFLKKLHKISYVNTNPDFAF
jgi:hypothetical protein